MERVLPINFFDAGEDPLTDLASDIQLEREAQEALLLRELEREAGELIQLEREAHEARLLRELEREAGELSEEGLLQRLHDERVQGEQRRASWRRGARNPLRAAWDALGFGRSFKLDPRAGRDLATGRRVRR